MTVKPNNYFYIVDNDNPFEVCGLVSTKQPLPIVGDTLFFITPDSADDDEGPCWDEFTVKRRFIGRGGLPTLALGDNNGVEFKDWLYSAKMPIGDEANAILKKYGADLQLLDIYKSPLAI